MKLSIVVPFYNEVGSISIFYKRLINSLHKDFKNFSYEIIAVDDGSEDDTLQELEKIRKNDKNLKIISFSRNFGHHVAITAGFDFASGDYIVMMDGDMQDQPEEIIKLYQKLKEGNDVVYAVRKNKKFSLFKKICSNLFNTMIRSLLNEKIVINSTIFRIMTKQVAENLRLMRETNRYVVGLIGWVGFKHGYCDVEHGKRLKGETKYNLIKQLELAVNAVTSFSDYPLRITSRIGVMLVIISFFLTLFVIYNKLVYNSPIIGWTSIFTSIVFMGGIQIIILGIIGEYVGKNYIESKKRPLYIIKTKQL